MRRGIPCGVSLLGLWGLSLGCVEGPESRVVLAPLDFDRFVDSVQPVLIELCANPSCHGSLERPFALYAVQQHRLDPALVYLNVPLTPEEVWANYQRSRAVAGDGLPSEESPLAIKPLAPSEGGGPHVGGVQFYDRADPSFLAIARWLDGGDGEGEGVQ